MRHVSRAAIERYVAADQPLDRGIKLESRGIVLFDKIETVDHTAITGLPLIALTTILRNLGFDILEAAHHRFPSPLTKPASGVAIKVDVPVVRLDRTLASEARGCRFKCCRAYEAA